MLHFSASSVPTCSRPRHVTNSGYGKARGQSQDLASIVGNRRAIEKPIIFLTILSQIKCLCFQHVVHATHPIPCHPVDAHNRCFALLCASIQHSLSLAPRRLGAFDVAALSVTRIGPHHHSQANMASSVSRPQPSGVKPEAEAVAEADLPELSSEDFRLYNRLAELMEYYVRIFCLCFCSASPQCYQSPSHPFSHPFQFPLSIASLSTTTSAAHGQHYTRRPKPTNGHQTRRSGHSSR